MTVFLLWESEVPWMEVASEKSQSATVLDLQAWTFYNLYQTTNWWHLLSDLHVPHEFCSERLISISDAFSAFVYGYPSSCPHAHCTPNKSVPTLCYAHRHRPVYTGHACRHLPSAVPWISKDHLLRRLSTFCLSTLWFHIRPVHVQVRVTCMFAEMSKSQGRIFLMFFILLIYLHYCTKWEFSQLKIKVIKTLPKTFWAAV